MRFKYVGSKKTVIYGKLVRPGDMVELDRNDTKIEWEYFREVKEEKKSKNKNKKEVDNYGEDMESP